MRELLCLLIFFRNLHVIAAQNDCRFFEFLGALQMSLLVARNALIGSIVTRLRTTAPSMIAFQEFRNEVETMKRADMLPKFMFIKQKYFFSNTSESYDEIEWVHIMV